MYAIANAANLQLTATAMSGYVFSHWVIGGYPLSHGAYSFTDTPSNNPYTVDHGYGYTYTYQPVFNAVSPATSPTPVTPELSSVAAAIALIAVALFAGIYKFKQRVK
jgi:hypothetical protein